MRKAPTYLTKFALQIMKKKHSRKSPKTGEKQDFEAVICKDFDTKYGYFNVTKSGNIDFIITLNDKKNRVNYIIKIAKSHIYKSLLLSLMCRPVIATKSQSEHFWVHKNIEPLIPREEMNDLIPSEVKERYEKAKTGLISIIEDESRDKDKRKAELQLERLLDQQWKMELLYEIYLSEKVVDESKEKCEKK